MTSSEDAETLKPLLELELGQRIFDAIKAIGGEARFVGGVLRDLFHGDEWTGYPDLDMAMDIPPLAAKTALENVGLRVLPTGIDHGTITVFDRRNDKLKVELTSLRHDLETDGRHAVVGFTKNWDEDAARRDFTINSIYASADGTVFDPFDGRGDLALGRVQFIGNAEERIAEDYLRILRFFRFYGQFARTPPDEVAMAAIAKSKHGLKQISGERIAAEITRIINTALTKNETANIAAMPAMLAMINAGVDQVIVPNGFNSRRLQGLIFAATTPPLAALFAAMVEDVEGFSQRLKLSGKMRRMMTYFTAGGENLPALEGASWQVAAWNIKPDNTKQEGGEQGANDAARLTALRYAIASLRTGRDINKKCYARLNAWIVPKFPLKGRDLIAQGYDAGAGLGGVLAELERHWVMGGFNDDKDILLAVSLGKLLNANTSKSQIP